MRRIVVTTSTFSVMGTTWPVNASAVQGSSIFPSNVTMTEIFYGVPYGQSTAPPNRFLLPIPVQPYTNTINTTSFQNYPNCYIQAYYPAFNWSEDCLRMYIHRPQGTQAGANLPVFFYLYSSGRGVGAAFTQAPPYDVSWPNLYVAQSVIVVQVVSRLHILGFAYDGNGQFTNNLGILDQRLAIQWIHNNIWAFGGDNTRVTAFSSDTGACEIGYHGIHPATYNYFQQAVQLQNGISTPYCSPGSANFVRHIPTTLGAAAKVGCTDPNQLRACLNTKTLLQIVQNGTTAYYFAAPLNETGDFNVHQWGTIAADPELFPNGTDLYPMLKLAPPKPTMFVHEHEWAIFIGVAGASYNWTIDKTQFFTYSAANLTDFIPKAVMPLNRDWSNAAAVGQLGALYQQLINFYVNQDNQVNVSTQNFYIRQNVRFKSDIIHNVGVWWEARIKAQLGWPVYMVHNTALKYGVWATQQTRYNETFPFTPEELDGGPPFFLDYNFAVAGAPMSAAEQVTRQIWMESMITFIKTGQPSPGWPRLQYNSTVQCSNTANYTATVVNLGAPVTVETVNSTMGARFAFYDQLAQNIDMRLVQSFPDILGVCLPCNLRTQMLSPNNNAAPLIVAINGTLNNSTVAMTPTGKLSFSTRFSYIRNVVAGNGTAQYPTPAAQINSIMNNYIAWAAAGINNSLSPDVAKMNDTLIAQWGTIRQFINCGFMQ